MREKRFLNLLLIFLASGAAMAAQPSAEPRHCAYCGRPAAGEAAPFAVIVDNHRNARPPSGLNQACLVVEAPVEGGITRFMALYGHGQAVPKIGPVRSIRPYFVAIARGLGAVLVHCGGSPGGYELASNLNMPRLDDIYGGYRAFWREKTRPSPHNLYTGSPRVQTEIRRKGLTPPAISTPPSTWAEPGTPRFAVLPPIVLPYAEGVSFVPGPTGYERMVRGKRQLDEAGRVLAAANLVLIEVSPSVLDRLGRLSIPLDDRCPCMVYSPGGARLAYWSGDGWAGSVHDYHGRPLALSPGLLWLALIPSPPVPRYDPTPVRLRVWNE